MLAVPTRTAVEIVQFAPESLRASQWFRALELAAQGIGIDVHRSQEYRGDAPWILLWGPGAPARNEAMRAHVAAGGHAIALDLAYWDRQNKARMSIDAPHPQAFVMRHNWPSYRVVADRITVRNAWDPNGPIIIAGLGDKARVQYGSSVVDRWEAEMMRACQARWPNKSLVYRRKRNASPTPAWASVAPNMPIDQLLENASLVATWHSNVAVDAIRMGIPAICRDGAAAAVCPHELGSEDPLPLDSAVRDQFLANLSFFQWSTDEASRMWRVILHLLS